MYFYDSERVKRKMSGFIYPQPTFISSCYNPAFYLSLDQTGYLTYAYAQTLYLGINDYRLSYITGITPGTATPGIALVVASDGSLSGLGALSCSSLTVGGSAVSAPPTYVLGITPGAAAVNKALVLNSTSDINGINSLSATSLTGTLQTASQPNITSVANLNITAHDGVSHGLSLGGTLITASASEINYVDVTAGTAAVSKALVLNASGNISGINSLSATSLSGTIQTAAQPNITSLGTLSSISCSGSISGTLSTAAQPNITSVGTLTGLSLACTSNWYSLSPAMANNSNFAIVHGKSTSNLNCSTFNWFHLSDGSSSNRLEIGIAGLSASVFILASGRVGIKNSAPGYDLDVTGSVSATNLYGTIQTAAQPNITSLGTLTGISCSGNISGTLTTGSQTNITSLGTLSGLTISGNLSLTGSSSSITLAGAASAITANSLTGTLQTAAQTNITSVGTLTSLSITNNCTVAGTNINNNTARTTSSLSGSFTAAGGIWIGKNVLQGGTNFSLASWGTVGAAYSLSQTTYTDTSASGTVSSAAICSWFQPTIAASNSRTITTAATFYIDNAPSPGVNVGITNSYAIWIGNGASYLAGNLTSSTNSVNGGTLQVAGDIGCTNAVNATVVHSTTGYMMNQLVSAQNAYYCSTSTGLDYLDGTYSKHASFRGSNVTPIELSIQVDDRTNTTSTNSAFIGTLTANDLRFGVGDSTKMIISGNSSTAGRVSIGSTTALYGLYVGLTVSTTIDAGSTGVAYFKASGGLVSTTGPISSVPIAIACAGSMLSSTAYYTYSDARLKKNFEPIEEDVCEALLKVEPCYFNYKNDEEGSPMKIGYSAQSLLKAGLFQCINIVDNPNLDVEDESIDLPGRQFCVDYSKMSCLLHKLALRQQRQINDLIEQVNEFKKM